MNRREPRQYYHLDLHPKLGSPDVPREPFSLGQASWLGFDLDHTIIRYKLAAFLPFVYRVTVQQLVEVQGYEAELMNLPYRSELVKKGVVLDKQLGHLVKLDDRGRVVRAVHAHASLSAGEILDAYPGGVLPGFTGLSDERYWPFPTYFDMTCGTVFAAVLQLRETGGARLDSASYSKIATDIFSSLNYNYGTFESGYYFGPFCASVGEYVYAQPHVRHWLEAMRAEGFGLFLLTNSMAPYTHVLMSFAYGPDWRSLFDLVICTARKPTFWSAPAPGDTFDEIVFLDEPVCSRVAKAPVRTALLQPAVLYAGGHASALQASLAAWPTRPGARWGARALAPSDIVYFGDHIPYDCATAKRYGGWRTVAIVEEIEADRDASAPHLLASTAWHCFFTVGADSGDSVHYESEPSRYTFWKLLLDESADAAIASMRELCAVHPDTPLNAAGSFFYRAHHLPELGGGAGGVIDFQTERQRRLDRLPQAIRDAVPPGITVRPNAYGHALFATHAFAAGATVFIGRWLDIPDELGDLTLYTQDASYPLNTLHHSVQCCYAGETRRQQYGFDVFMNHSCAPNTGFGDVSRWDEHYYTSVALRAIAPGDEITCDYLLLEYGSGGSEIDECACGAPGCVGNVAGFGALTRAQQCARIADVLDCVFAQFVDDLGDRLTQLGELGNGQLVHIRDGRLVLREDVPSGSVLLRGSVLALEHEAVVVGLVAGRRVMWAGACAPSCCPHEALLSRCERRAAASAKRVVLATGGFELVSVCAGRAGDAVTLLDDSGAATI